MNQPMKHKIILDVDPGHDDAMAMLLAYASPAIDLLAITTVAGNQTIEKTTLNARRVATVAGMKGVSIAAGCDRPMVRPQIVAADIHGESGLDGPRFPEPTVPLDPRHAVDLIIELLLNSDGDITLVPTGPLTNVAMAMRQEPAIIKKIKHISLMGGAIGFGNSTPSAEFNIYADAEAARIVFESGVPITMVGLDLTHQALATESVVERIRAFHTPVSEMAVDLLHFFASTYKARQGFDAPPVHDPCAVAWVIDPTLIQTKNVHVDIETNAEFSYGRTVCDMFGDSGKPANALVATKLDFDRFWDLVIDALSRY
ncbi:MAG: nucleoside hydrolase [Firmicutes bacterium]|nr:nucleoside hydrolase [Bacillota bacterium]